MSFFSAAPPCSYISMEISPASLKCGTSLLIVPKRQLCMYAGESTRCPEPARETHREYLANAFYQAKVIHKARPTVAASYWESNSKSSAPLVFANFLFSSRCCQALLLNICRTDSMLFRAYYQDLLRCFFHRMKWRPLSGDISIHRPMLATPSMTRLCCTGP